MAIRFASLLLLLGAGMAEAQKTDSVWIRNGDRITGEAKLLRRGLLTYETDDLGTIYIEWDKVLRLYTRQVMEVRLISGEKFFGSLDVADTGRVVLASDTLLLADMVMMAPIEGTFVARLNGYLDLGFSYQKANSTLQLTTGTQVIYRAPRDETRFQLTTFVENREDADETSRFSTALAERLFIATRWSTGFLVGFDQNDELDLAGRGRLVAFGTRTVAETNDTEFLVSGGVVVARERFYSTDSTTNSLEGMMSGSFRAFRYDAPKLDASLTSQVFPSFSIKGRVRLQTDMRVSYELISDFMLTVSVFDTFDSKPPSVEATKHDFGTTAAITWSF